MYRVDGKLIRETIGTLALIPNVADARERARESMTAAQAGRNPVGARREREFAAKIKAEAPSNAFRAVATRYLERHAKKHTKPTTWKELERQLGGGVFPEWGGRTLPPVCDQANRPRARLKTLFKWTLDEELITADPTALVRKVVKETARDRTLSDDEISLFWRGCDKLGWPFGPMYKLLLLTAQRRDEVGGLEWSEIDFDRRVWIIPREKAKN